MKVGRAIFALFILMQFAACSRNDTVRYSLGGRTFDIPAGYLIEESPAWLPQSDERAPLISLDAKHDITVLLQDTERLCRSGTQVRGDWSYLCDPNWREFSSVSEEDLQNARKTPDGYNVTRRYLSPDGSGRVKILAVCTPITGSDNDLCRNIYRVDGLMLTVSFNESDLHDIPKIRSTVINLLNGWERHPTTR